MLPLGAIDNIEVSDNVVEDNQADGITIRSDDVNASVTRWSVLRNVITVQGHCGIRAQMEARATLLATNQISAIGDQFCKMEEP